VPAPARWPALRAIARWAHLRKLTPVQRKFYLAERRGRMDAAEVLRKKN
jgi:hypothetical protein